MMAKQIQTKAFEARKLSSLAILTLINQDQSEAGSTSEGNLQFSPICSSLSREEKPDFGDFFLNQPSDMKL